MEQHGLDRKSVVVPQRQPVEWMPMPREVRELFVFRLVAIDDAGRRLPGKPIRALGAVSLHSVDEHFDVIGEQEVVVIEEIEPLATRFGKRG